jgi:hypothetical protein
MSTGMVPSRKRGVEESGGMVRMCRRRETRKRRKGRGRNSEVRTEEKRREDEKRRRFEG